MQTAHEVLQGLQEFFDAGPELEAATAARSNGDDGTLDGRFVALADDAEEHFRRVIAETVLDEMPAWDLRRLDPLYKPDARVVEWQRASDLPTVRFAEERYSDLNPLTPFDPGDEEYKRRLVYWVCVLTGADGRKAFFFRAFSSSAELARKAATAMFLRGGTLTKVRERIFLFDNAVDCFVFDGYLYVLRKVDFRRIFDQLELVRAHARQAARSLHAKVPIANFDAFADACAGQIGMADKLIAVMDRDYFDRLSYDMLEPVIKEFKLEIPVEERDGATHLVFRSEPAHRWRILRLIDDDYLSDRR